jgi:hypothetical protein
MARSTPGLGAAHDAMTQARTGYACAGNAGHDGLRAWTRGLQALITYRSGRLADSVRYAQSGAEASARSHGTARVWLAVTRPGRRSAATPPSLFRSPSVPEPATTSSPTTSGAGTPASYELRIPQCSPLSLP